MAELVWGARRVIHELLQGDQSGFISRVENQVRKIDTDLAFLMQRAGSEEDGQLDALDRDVIRSLAYKVMDAFESYFVKCKSREAAERRGRMVLGCEHLKRISIAMFSRNINVRDLVDDVNTTIDFINIGCLEERDQIVNYPELDRQSSVRHEYDPPGKEDELSQLIGLLTNDDETTNRVVVSLCGMAGLGKTWMARAIYNRAFLQNCFQALAWVRVTRKCQTDDLVRKIRGQLHDEEGVPVGSVQEELIHILRNKRCLIVLDDVWRSEDWDSLSPYLLASGTISRILLTTRNRDVAKDGFIYPLRFLTPDESWQLCRSVTRYSLSRVQGNVVDEKLLRELVGHCEGLPITIIRLGRLFSSFSDLRTLREVESHLARNPVIRGDNSDRDISKLITMSYDDLPHVMKPCFYYFSNFMEAQKLDVEDLFLLWMAEDIVSDSSGKTTAMELAEHYLSELASRCMVRVVVHDEFSRATRFKSCWLHATMQELSVKMARREDFRIMVMDFRDGKWPLLDISSLKDDNIRRLTVHFNQETKPSISYDEMALDTEFDKMICKKLRSLMFLNCHGKPVKTPIEVSDFGKFKLLHILKFVRCRFDGRKLPRGIEWLMCLRYLALIYCDLDEVPSSISNISRLQTLDVRAYHNRAMNIPESLKEMVRLKHLHLPGYIKHHAQRWKVELDCLYELDTLIGFNNQIHDISNPSNMVKLRCLKANAFDNTSLCKTIELIEKIGKYVRDTKLHVGHKCSFTSTRGLVLLRKLLTCTNLKDLTLSMVPIYRFPDSECHLVENLVQLKILGCKLKEDPMGLLGKFPGLRTLCLGYGAFLGTEMTCSGFRALENLEFHNLPNLETWQIQDTMSRLSHVEIRCCPKLGMIPDGLIHTDALKRLDIELAPMASIDDQIRVYLQRFERVRSVSIRKIDPYSANENNVYELDDED